MKEFRARIIINAAATDVWKVLLQAEDYAKFDPSCHKIDGEIKNGGAIRFYSARPPRKINYAITLPADESKMLWHRRLPLNLLEHTRTFEVTPKDDHTSEFNLQARTSGPLANLCSKLAPKSAREFEQFARGLKGFIEARP